tara:strand:- start:488 stop:742 length:255 start_codon:yes stop_codon:yes gene_type:complete
VSNVAYSLGLAMLIMAVSFAAGTSILQSLGLSLIVVPALLLGIDLTAFGKHQEELKKLTSGGLWVHELEQLSNKDLDGDDEVGL